MSGDFLASIRRLMWFLVGVLIVAVWMIPSARAVETCTGGTCTQPADTTGGSVTPTRWLAQSYTACNAPATYTTAVACANAAGGSTRTLKAGYPKGTSDGHYTDFWYTDLWEVFVYPSCAAGSTITYVANTQPTCQAPTTYTCPSTGGWTLSGTNCTRPACVSPKIRGSDGTCVDPCTVAENDQVDPGGVYEITSHGAEISDCVNGCRVYIGGKTFKEGGRSYGQAWSYGTPCLVSNSVPGVEATPEEESCAKRGLCGGTFNGAPVCTACDETSQTTTTKKVETPSSGTPVTTTTTTTEICKEAGSCTTTTTVSSSAGGSTTTTTKAPGGTGPGEGTTPSGTGSCANDTSAIECANSTYTPAVCSAAPICTGDAVQCAQALEVWKTRCEVLKAITPDVADDAPISEADAKESTREAYQEQMDTIKDQITGALPDPSADSKSAWESALSSGWFDAITITGCTAVDYSVGPYVWHFDPCPTAEKISTIGSYALWLTLVVGGFVFVTGGRNAGMSH